MKNDSSDPKNQKNVLREHISARDIDALLLRIAANRDDDVQHLLLAIKNVYGQDGFIKIMGYIELMRRAIANGVDQSMFFDAKMNAFIPVADKPSSKPN